MRKSKINNLKCHGRPIAKYIGGPGQEWDVETFFSHANAIGSTSMMTWYDGDVVQKELFYPYGQLWATGGDIGSYRFAGLREYFPVSDSAEIFMSQTRDYPARFYRWLSPDEFTGGPVSACGPPDPTPSGALPYADILNPQSLNKYQYAYNNPLRYNDPTGHWCVWGIGTTCDPKPPALPPLPPAPEGAPGTTTYPLVRAQDAARSNPSFRPQGEPDTAGRRTFCNQATCFVANETGAPAGPLVDTTGSPTNANTMAGSLATSGAYREVSPAKAQPLANQGVTVIAAWQNPDGSGHVATARPDNTYFAPYELGPDARRNGPRINNIGASIGIVRQSGAFPRTALVKYYAPN